ncbi:PREDICTED: uncharacterized protein LOC100631408 [Amphimedon queenslandica]|uniref:Uncharacterized protein n=1 Tax=Amphimedon queenslandica TaxID=400682 RepID=A0A1X7UIK5_AMPQE|nr:PREDICTED: uncharacterized protein LOC100631408 [Amphimedon queenslandica]|eukprot:XP_003387855.1 PREDICTED: uncharacterized protein LOC100631408 [Amphimedon queenslandica]
MGRFYCHCLNVTLSYRGGDGRGLDRSSAIRIEELLGSTDLPDQLLNKTLVTVSLDVAGIISEQPLLLRSYSVGVWDIVHCLNCSTDVFIKHKENKERLLVFSSLLTDPSTLKFHPNYSPVFSIILKDKMEDNPQLKERMSSMTFGQDDLVMKELQAQTESYLTEEEQKMEQAIREFEAKKREEFRKLKEKAHEDRRRLFLSLQLAKEAELVTSLTDATDDDAVTPLVDARREDRATQQGPSDIKGASTNVPTLKPGPIKSPLQVPEVSNNDDIFDFDEDMIESGVPQGETAASPFPLSSDDDEYDSSSNGSSLEERYRVRTSLPASLPLTMPYLANRENYMESNEVKQSPSNLALSIQKLALSVHDTGMFGDLPKPRVKSSHRH